MRKDFISIPGLKRDHGILFISAVSRLTHHGSSDKPFRFFDLAREIRDQIYFFMCGDQEVEIFLDPKHDFRCLLVTWARITICDDPGSVSRSRRPTMMELFLLSRQFSTEAAHTLYTTSRFYFFYPGALFKFLSTVPMETLRQIHAVFMNFTTQDLSERLIWEDILDTALITRLQGLRQLTLQLKIWDANDTFPGWVNYDVSTVKGLLSSSRILPMLNTATLEVKGFGGPTGQNEVNAQQYMKEARGFVMGDACFGAEPSRDSGKGKCSEGDNAQIERR